MSLWYHVLVVQSKSSLDSTNAWTTHGCVLFGKVECFSWFLTLNHSALSLLILFFRSVSAPAQHHNIRIFFPSSVSKSSVSSFSPFFFSSNSAMMFLNFSTPVSISPFLPIIVVLSAKSDKEMYTSTGSLLYFSQFFSLRMLFPVTHFYFIPSSWFIS